MRRSSPAAQRNRAPILAALRVVLPPSGTLLEIASGSGEHAVHFAAALPAWTFQPTDRDPSACASVDAWRVEARLVNVLPALQLDVEQRPWPIAHADAVFCANMIHIAPWSAALALLDGAADVLPPGAPLVLYGPFRRDDVVTAPSNEAFDADLRARDPRWGVRRLEDVVREAEMRGLRYDTLQELPANNIVVVLRRALTGAASAPG